MNLYELSEQFNALLAQVEAEATNADAEESSVLYDMLSDAGLELDDKIENIVKYVKTLSAQAEAHKKEALAQKALQQSAERKVESLKKYLLSADVTAYECPYGKITSRKSKAVEIDDLGSIPEEYINEKVTYSADKVEIKKKLNLGGVVDGARIVERVSIGVK